MRLISLKWYIVPLKLIKICTPFVVWILARIRRTVARVWFMWTLTQTGKVFAAAWTWEGGRRHIHPQGGRRALCAPLHSDVCAARVLSFCTWCVARALKLSISPVSHLQRTKLYTITSSERAHAGWYHCLSALSQTVDATIHHPADTYSAAASEACSYFASPSQRRENKLYVCTPEMDVNSTPRVYFDPRLRLWLSMYISPRDDLMRIDFWRIYVPALSRSFVSGEEGSPLCNTLTRESIWNGSNFRLRCTFAHLSLESTQTPAGSAVCHW